MKWRYFISKRSTNSLSVTWCSVQTLPSIQRHYWFWMDSIWMNTELVTLIFGPYLEPVVTYRSSVLPIWTCAWIHLLEFAASLQQHPCMKLCSQTEAHWFFWYLFQVIAACDEALSVLLCSSVKIVSKWRWHVSHWNHTPQNSDNTIQYTSYGLLNTFKIFYECAQTLM